MRRADSALPNPTKLVELEHPYAELIARGNREYEAAPEETERFYRRHSRPSAPPRPRALWLAPVAAAALLLLALALGVFRRDVGVSMDATTTEAARQAPAALPLDRAQPAPVVAESTGVELGVGERTLSDGSRVNLSSGGSARLREVGKTTSVVLDGGKLTLAVEPRHADAELEVLAGTYRFKVIGTKFSVTRSGERVELDVDEGHVAVRGLEGELVTVSAGGNWSSADPTRVVPTNDEPAAPIPAPTRPETRALADHPASTPDCRDLARRGESRKAEACYLERATGTRLEAETALLEVARLRRDVLGELPSALSALEDYRKRFPNGSLRSEADLAHVVLLTRLGRHDEALAESQGLLDSPKGNERAFELHLLRGNIYRKNLGNPTLAAREYAKGEQLDGTSSEATYFLGSCLEDLGDAQGAASAYRRYLDKAPSGKRAADVRERLERLSP